MRIHRSQLDGRFTQVPNETLRDERLSYTARGILCELLSHRDGWEMSADRMSEQAREEGRTRRGEGRRAIRAAFAELEAAGYITRERTRGERGRFQTELYLYDRPHRHTASGTSEAQDVTAVEMGCDPPFPSSDRRTANERPASGTSNRRPSTNTEDGRDDLASRRARPASRTSAKRTVQSVIADVRIAAASVHGKDEANSLEDGHALGLYYHYAHRKEVHDLVAYMVKIFSDAPYLDAFIANAGWCCPTCQRWGDECACAA